LEFRRVLFRSPHSTTGGTIAKTATRTATSAPLTPWKMKKSGLPPTTASIGCTTTNPHNANSSRNATSSPRHGRPPTTTGGRRGAGWESGVAWSVTADPRVQGPGPGGQRLGTGDGEPFPEQPLEHVGPVVVEQAGGLVGQQPLRHRVGRVDELH